MHLHRHQFGTGSGRKMTNSVRGLFSRCQNAKKHTFVVIEYSITRRVCPRAPEKSVKNERGSSGNHNIFVIFFAKTRIFCQKTCFWTPFLVKKCPISLWRRSRASTERLSSCRGWYLLVGNVTYVGYAGRKCTTLSSEET